MQDLGLDGTVVLIYLVATFWLGLRGARMLGAKRETEEEYYLAGRSIPGWVNGISLAVTLVNADVAPAYCGLTAVVGLPVAWFYISRFGLGLLIASLLFAVRWHQLNIRTGPEFFTLRFSGGSARWVRAYASAYAVAIGTVPWIGAGLLGVHMIFAPILGIDSKLVTLLLVLPVMVAYVWVAGFAGVLVTDVMQTGVILAANICVLVAVLVEFGGPAGLADAVSAALPEKSAEILSLTPVPGHAIASPLIILAWSVVWTIGFGGSVGLEGQRIFSCRSPRSAASVGVWCEVALFVMLALLTLPTLGVLANHPELHGSSPQVRETAYSLLLQDFLPPGLLGLALAALLAAVMSTVAGHLNYGSQTLLNDICRQFVPSLTDDNAVRWGRLLMLGLLGLSIAVMSFSESLVGIAVVVAGLNGASLTFSWGQWWWWRANTAAWCAANIGGPIVYALSKLVVSYWPWWQAQAAASDSARQSMDILHAAMAMALTTLLWIAVALATRPEAMEPLKQFFLRARPMGLWGPVRRALADNGYGEHETAQPRGAILTGFGISLVGAAWIALGILALTAASVGRWATTVTLAAAAIVLGLAFWKLFRWQINRLIDAPTAAPSRVR